MNPLLNLQIRVMRSIIFPPYMDFNCLHGSASNVTALADSTAEMQDIMCGFAMRPLQLTLCTYLTANDAGHESQMCMLSYLGIIKDKRVLDKPAHVQPVLDGGWHSAPGFWNCFHNQHCGLYHDMRLVCDNAHFLDKLQTCNVFVNAMLRQVKGSTCKLQETVTGMGKHGVIPIEFEASCGANKIAQARSCTRGRLAGAQLPQASVQALCTVLCTQGSCLAGPQNCLLHDHTVRLALRSGLGSCCTCQSQQPVQPQLTRCLTSD